MLINRLSHIEDNLNIFREQLGGMERTLNLSPMEEQIRIRQQIRELRNQIRDYEQEYRQVIAKQAKIVEIPEPEAEIIVAEIVKELGQIEVQTASSLNNLAALYESMGRYPEAEPLYVRSLSIYEQQLGADHPDTALSLNNLAALYYAMGRYAEAEPLYVRSLSIYEQQLGADHPNTATTLSNQAELYRAMGRYPEAEPLYLRALEISFHRLGENHPNTQTAWSNFIHFLREAISAGQDSQLSQHPTTQAMLQQLRETE